MILAYRGQERGSSGRGSWQHELIDVTTATAETEIRRQMSLCPSCSWDSVPGGLAGACPGDVSGQSSSHSEGTGRASPQYGSASVSPGGAVGQSSSHTRCTRGSWAPVGCAAVSSPQGSLQLLGLCRTCLPHASSGGWPDGSCIGNSCHTQSTCWACHACGFSGAGSGGVFAQSSFHT